MNLEIKTLNLCCTTCPLECELGVEVQGDKVLRVAGNICKRGIKFAQKEITTPERTLTTTILVTEDGDTYLLPVKTAAAIPKKRMMAAMKEISQTRIKGSCQRGDVVIKNIAASGVDVVACRSTKEKYHAC